MMFDTENLNRLMYWITERHKVYLAKQEGNPKPWSSDPIFQSVFFTNPYRENDKTTVWFRDNLRNLLQNDARVFFATVFFRWFNLIKTGEVLLKAAPNKQGLFTAWRKVEVSDVLYRMEPPVFTGAFMIKAGNGAPGCKIRNICAELDLVHKEQDKFVTKINGGTLQNAFNTVCHIPYIGPFLGAQLVADLKYTYLLKDAPDWHTWCALGPGSTRGLNRMLNRGVQESAPKDWRDVIGELQLDVNNRLLVLGMDIMHAQDIQNCLCEYDKMCRIIFKDGMKVKRNYPGAK